MKKLWLLIKSIFNPEKIGDAVIDELGDFAEESVEKMYAKKPKAARALIQSLYAWVPFAEEAAAKTATKWDDKATAEAKSEIEEFAAKFNIDLVDLDAETPAA